MSWYKNHIKIAQGQYSNRVTPDIYYSSPEGKNIVVEADPVDVPFSLDIDLRQWGLKGIMAYASATIAVHLTITEWTDDEDVVNERDIQVDLSELSQDNTTYGHGSYTVVGLLIHLDENLNLIKDRSSVGFSQG